MRERLATIRHKLATNMVSNLNQLLTVFNWQIGALIHQLHLILLNKVAALNLSAKTIRLRQVKLNGSRKLTPLIRSAEEHHSLTYRNLLLSLLQVSRTTTIKQRQQSIDYHRIDAVNLIQNYHRTILLHKTIKQTLVPVNMTRNRVNILKTKPIPRLPNIRTIHNKQRSLVTSSKLHCRCSLPTTSRTCQTNILRLNI